MTRAGERRSTGQIQRTLTAAGAAITAALLLVVAACGARSEGLASQPNGDPSGTNSGGSPMAAPTPGDDSAPPESNAGQPGQPGQSPQGPIMSRDAGSSPGAIDASEPVPVCHDLGKFSAPNLVTAFGSDMVINGAWPMPNGQQIYLSGFSHRTGDDNSELFVAEIHPVDGGIKTVVPLTDVNTQYPERRPVVTPDGLTLFFATERAGDSFDIYWSKRSKVTEPFGPGQPIEQFSRPGIDEPGSLSTDGTVLFYGRGRYGILGKESVFHAMWDGAGHFEQFLLSAADSDYSTIAPVISSSERTLIFSSNRPGDDTLGGFDIFQLERSSVRESFHNPELVVELNSEGNDFLTWMSLDECEVWLISDRSGDERLYAARRMRP